MFFNTQFENDFEVIELNKTTRPVSYLEYKTCLQIEQVKHQNQTEKKIIALYEMIEEAERATRQDNYESIKKMAIELRKRLKDQKILNRCIKFLRLDKFGDVKDFHTIDTFYKLSTYRY